jgi:formylglycine-generating enzyme
MAARAWSSVLASFALAAVSAAAAACNALIGIEDGKLKLCTDGIQNGDETGVDCGGEGCAPCSEALLCNATGGCDGGGPTACDDGVLGGNELGVDCGGSCPPCDSGAGGSGSGGPPCINDEDCAAGVCEGSVCRCSMIGMILGDGFCIDAFEVSNKRYAAFLEQAPSVAGQPPECFANTDYGAAPPPDDRPVVDVDWCDALAFCASEGKRLCRGDAAAPLSAPASEWHSACSNAGERAFPYGDTFDAKACCGAGSGKDLIPVGDMLSCEGGLPSLFHMSGNAAEWEDACDAQGCRVRGGAFSSKKSDDMACAADRVEPRLFRSNDVGFRCCSDT